MDPRQTQHDPFITLAAAGLAALCDPLTPDAFLDEYWEQLSIHLPRQTARAWRLGLGLDELVALAAQLPEGAIRLRAESRVVSAELVEPLLAAGMSIELEQIQRAHPGVALLLGRLRRELGFLGHLSCDAHLASSGGGHQPRQSAHPMLHIQLEGSQSVAYGRGPAEAIDEKLRTSVLQAGDVLYVPGRTWHEASAGQRSVALTIGFLGRPLHALVAVALEEALRPLPAWRKLPRPALTPPPSLRAHFAARAAELRALVDTQIDGDWLARLCYPTPHNDHQTVGADERLFAPHALAPEVRADGIVIGAATLPTEALLFVTQLQRVSTFTAAELLGAPGLSRAYTGDEINRWLGALVAVGALQTENIRHPPR